MATSCQDSRFAQPARNQRYVWMTVTGYVFYSFWNYKFCAVMALSTLISYIAGLALLSLAGPKLLAAGGSAAQTASPSDIDATSGFRLPLLKREDLDEDGKKVYDAVSSPSSPSSRRRRNVTARSFQRSFVEMPMPIARVAGIMGGTRSPRSASIPAGCGQKLR